jgi:alcohol dehydrogenase class IV
MLKDPKNEITITQGASNHVQTILNRLHAKSVFLVTHTIAYQNSGAEAKLEPFLADKHVVRFTDFEPNPKLRDAEGARSIWRNWFVLFPHSRPLPKWSSLDYHT